VSETFVAEASAGAANYPGGGTSASRSEKSALSISYDADAKRYTITRQTAGNTSFGATQLDAASGNAAVAVYRSASGTVTETVQLTKAGTSGAFNQEYVGGGLWRQLDTAGGVNQYRLGAFTYGMRSPDADVPATGSANFAIGLLATAATSDGLVDIYGTGLFQVDFATRQFTIQGANAHRQPASLGSTLPGFWSPGGFSGNGILASGANAFLGGIGIDAGQRYTGALNGFFYGPNLAEIGGTIAGFNTANQTLVGSIIGRKGDAAPVFETLATLIAPVSLQEATSQIRYRENSGGGGYNGASLDGRTQSSLSIDPATRIVTYSGILFSDANRVAAQSDARFTTYQINGAVARTLKVYNPGPGNTELALSYASFISGVNAATGEDRRWDSFTVFGLNTSGSNVPRTGHGVFNGRLYGSAVGAGATADHFSMEGAAGFDFDFAGASFTGSMTPSVTNLRTGVVSQLGTYTFQNGQIFPFYLAFGADIIGTPGASGSLNGSFYGPAAEEIGATFGLITPGAGTVLTGAGAIVAKRP
jgi:hypothetical protein